MALTTAGDAAPAFPGPNAAPKFDAATPFLFVDENESGVIGDFGATDPDTDPLAYSLSGDDAALFSIDSDGNLSFTAPPDFEDRRRHRWRQHL